MKTLTSIRSLGRSDLEALIGESSTMRDLIDGGATVEQSLAGLCVANLFFEPSTRTRLSFDLAAQKLGANVITFDPETSSTSKGESLRDSVRTVAAIGADVLVVRHSNVGVPQAVADWTGLPVVNAGDGVNEHPTQTLLDLVTLRRHFPKFDGLRMAIVGDISRSRVAAGLIHAGPILGMDLTLVGPPDWLPDEPPVPASSDLDVLLGHLDVVYLLRVQTERGGVISDEYISRFGLGAKRAARLPESAVVMHPGPINRGVEVDDIVAESPRSLITEQIRNGVPTRMTVFQSLDLARQAT